jgi:C4-dicarboxylate transporter, DctM subunit
MSSGSEAPGAAAAAAPREGAPIRVLRAAMTALAVAATAVVVIMPIADLASARIFWSGIAPAGDLAANAILVLAFASAALASLDKRHLSLGGSEPAAEDRSPRASVGRVLARSGDVVAVTTQTCLFWASLSLTFIGFDSGERVWIIPARAIAAIMPLCMACMTAFTIRNSGSTRAPRLAASLGILLGTFIASGAAANFLGAVLGSAPPFALAVAAAAQAFVHGYALPLGLAFALTIAFGAPIFTVIGGLAVILFVGSGQYVELAPREAYALLEGGSISALPLFGIAGILLAQSGAGSRFVALFRELFGWFRGGEAIAAVLVCAFFSTFTGVNGVTIIALGGILASILVESGGMSEERARGLVTASGDIGLLIIPSAAVIVYGVNATFLYDDSSGFSLIALIKGALVPGLLLVACMCAAGVILSPKRARGERRFQARPALAAFKAAGFELGVPVIAIVLFFTGQAGLLEIAALCVLYIAFIECAVKRELGFKGLIAALGKAYPIVGGTLIVIAAARALSVYLTDADVPSLFASWLQTQVASRALFLLLVNLFLLLVGCLMDIFSAIIIVSPFLIPLGAAFGVDPVQFGVIFITNLLVGFLTPPVGMDIFLASYTFKKPISRIVKDVLPFLLVEVAVLAAITCIPSLSRVFH